jgi:hypothetical protein
MSLARYAAKLSLQTGVKIKTAERADFAKCIECGHLGNPEQKAKVIGAM